MWDLLGIFIGALGPLFFGMGNAFENMWSSIMLAVFGIAALFMFS